MPDESLGETLSSLLLLLDSGDWSEVRCAIRRLGALGADAAPAVGKLIEIVQREHRKDLSGGLSGEACQALGSIGPLAAGAVSTLCALLLTPRDVNIGYVRGDAALALGRIGSVEAVPALVQAAQDADRQGPGECALEALGSIGAAAVSAVPGLQALLNRDEFKPETKYIILGVLFRLGAECAGWQGVTELLHSGRESLVLVAIRRTAWQVRQKCVVPDKIRQLIASLVNQASTGKDARVAAKKLIRRLRKNG